MYLLLSKTLTFEGSNKNGEEKSDDGSSIPTTTTLEEKKRRESQFPSLFCRRVFISTNVVGNPFLRALRVCSRERETKRAHDCDIKYNVLGNVRQWDGMRI